MSGKGKHATTVKMPSLHYIGKVPAGSHRTGKRGRPRKPPMPSTVVPRLPFVGLPEGPIKNPEKLAEWLRTYVQQRPHLDDGTGDLTAWLSAAAAALESGDAARVAWYCLNALRAQYIAAQLERIDFAQAVANVQLMEKCGLVKTANTVRELADIGAAKIVTDKRKGHRGSW